MRIILVFGIAAWCVAGVLLTPFAFGMALSCLALLVAERLASSAEQSVHALEDVADEREVERDLAPFLRDRFATG